MYQPTEIVMLPFPFTDLSSIKKRPVLVMTQADNRGDMLVARVENILMSTPFQQACYDLLKQVPQGKITTYAEIAHALGTKAYRAVGTAMNKNPNPIIVPCHRVVNADGRLGQYAFGYEQKQQLLQSEGINIVDGKIQYFKHVLFRFTAINPLKTPPNLL